jgi:hypothetical protein
MASIVISENLREDLLNFLKKNKKGELIEAYLYFLEKKMDIRPVLFIRQKTIYQSCENLIQQMEKEGKLWRETEIKIQMGQPAVNEQTKKIYICPFSGKVFGDNTHPNPQDAIYEWVSKCPENTDRMNGLRVKRFFTSEDREVIKNYIVKRKEAVKKVVFSSVVTGKLFNSKQAVIEDFTKNQLKEMEFVGVPNQNRYQIEGTFLSFIQSQLEEGKISAFVEAASKVEEFAPYLDRWLEDAAE